MKTTKYETKFFSIAENFCFEFDDNGKYNFDRYDYELNSIIEKFQSEIIENCTKLSENDRDFYLNRLKNRLHPIGLNYYFVEEKDGQFIENANGTLTETKGHEIEYEQLIPFGLRIENKGVFYTIKPEEAKQYFAMLKDYKRILLRRITEITKQQNKLEQEKYIIPNDPQMNQIFEICKSTIDCDYLLFRKSIVTANFHLLNIKRQNFVKDLTYRLSNIMGNEWYGEVCMKMNWTKSQCSGQGEKLEGNLMTKELNKILPRPGK